MTHNAKPGLETCGDERIFVSPVALACVRTIVIRRGATESQARRLYLGDINLTQPGRERGRCSAA